MSPGNLPIYGILFPKMKTKPSIANNKPIKIKIFPNSATIMILQNI